MLDKLLKAASKFAKLQISSLHFRLAFVQLVVRCIPHETFNGLRATLYRTIFPNISKRVYIAGKLDLRGNGNIYSRLSIGERTTINTPCFIELSAPVTIGREVAMANHVIIITSSHEIGPAHRRALGLRQEPVSIGDGAWVGACSTITPGITIGAGAFVTVGSIVIRDVPASAQVAGNPARVVAWLDKSTSGGDVAPASATQVSQNGSVVSTQSQPLPS